MTTSDWISTMEYLTNTKKKRKNRIFLWVKTIFLLFELKILQMNDSVRVFLPAKFQVSLVLSSYVENRSQDLLFTEIYPRIVPWSLFVRNENFFSFVTVKNRSQLKHKINIKCHVFSQKHQHHNDMMWHTLFTKCDYFKRQQLLYHKLTIILH